MKHILYLLSICFILINCKQQNSKKTEVASVENQLYAETYRPQYHFSPKEKWMNDPNGLVYHDGTYHLFYQYYPGDIVWGPMHWGHATSKDLKIWKHKPIALYPDSLGYIFSGSAVFDEKNTSGLGTQQDPPLVAMYTYHDAEGEREGKTNYQTQGIAYSIDEGETWEKYKENPVIGNETNMKDFRDPKVFWYEPTQQWILLLVAGDHLKIYNSKNLIEWNYMSEFGKDKGAHGGVWECPDLFELKVEGTDEKKWVLFISINPGAPNGGSGTQYFVGNFDGQKFTTSTSEKWVDYGRDNYAGITYNNLPDDDRTFIGWMSNWDYGQETPTKEWRSAMTLPRKLELNKDESYFLSSYPVASIFEGLDYITPSSENPKVFKDSLLNQSNIKFSLPQPLTDFEIAIANKEDDTLKIGYKMKENEFYLDRTHAGIDDFSDNFSPTIMRAPAKFLKGDTVEFSIFTDRSSIEFFADKGATVMTAQVFPKSPYNSFSIKTETSIKDLKLAHIPDIWKTN